MARQISEVQSLPFHQLVGAPLLALVEGQAQAAQATVEFIQRVGFLPVETNDGQLADAEAPESNMGALRMAQFSYQRTDDDGQLQTMNVQVPVLSLVPIPAIQIKEAELEFYIKIADIRREMGHSIASASGDDPEDWASSNKVGFRASIGRMQTSTNSQQSTELQMHVKMKVEQADVPEGLLRLLAALDKGFSSQSE